VGEAPGDDKRFEVIKMNDSKRHREFVELSGPPEVSREYLILRVVRASSVLNSVIVLRILSYKYLTGWKTIPGRSPPIKKLINPFSRLGPTPTRIRVFNKRGRNCITVSLKGFQFFLQIFIYFPRNISVN
jgi:hypothetical protein